MTDAKLATLRAGCQRGEMPSYRQYADVLWMVHRQFDRSLAGLDSTEVAYRPDHEWGPRYLDALAALQEALWPGSRIAVEWRNNLCTVVIATPDGRFFGSRLCPTLATAWMDALLAGLMEKDDG